NLDGFPEPVTVNERTIALPGDPATLLPTDDHVFVANNTGGPVSLRFDGTPVPNQVITIIDKLGNAGDLSPVKAISYTGVINGATNPVIIDTEFGVAKLLFSGGSIYLE